MLHNHTTTLEMPSKLTFTDDGAVAASGSRSRSRAVPAAAERAVRAPAVVQDAEEDDEDDAPAEESIAPSARRAAEDAAASRESQRERNLKRKRAQDTRAAGKAKGKGRHVGTALLPPPVVEDDLDADLDEEEGGDGDDDDDAGAAGLRLDPALFEQAFARQAALYAHEESGDKPLKSALRKRDAAAPSKAQATGQDEAELAAKERAARRRKAQDRRDGIVRGNDGRPMKRLDDGRTVVRALSTRKTTFDDEDDEGNSALKAGPVEQAPELEALDPLQAKPNAHARAFLKRKLLARGGVQGSGARGGGAAAAKSTSASKAEQPAKTYDDPLGLEDPFLMKGGQYASENGHRKRLVGKPMQRTAKMRSGPAVARSRSGGGRVAGEYS